MKYYIITFHSGNKVVIEADNISISEGIVIFSKGKDIVCAFSFNMLESFICKNSL